LINGKHVIERGLQHGALYFMARIDPNGFPSYSKIWGETDKIKPLRDEVHERLAEARFVPAVYNHQHVFAWMSGTIRHYRLHVDRRKTAPAGVCEPGAVRIGKRK
jgi:hypothetical protein